MDIRGRSAAEIAASLEKRLNSGHAASGDALPSVRTLARRLAVSPATVAAAYKLLRLRGLTTGSGRRGTRVAPRPLVQSMAAPYVPGTAIDLASGNADPALLPPLDAALRALRSRAPAAYADSPPNEALRAFAAAEFEADGIPSRATAVVSGALDALDRILREHVRPGDRVAIEDPSFPGVIDLVAAFGCIPSPVGLDGRGPRPDALDEALRQECRAVVITPRAQNPTGAAIDKTRAGDLRRVLRRAPDVVVVENDYMAPIAGAPMFPIRTGLHDRWAVIRSTSKFLGPDLRVALLAGDDLTVSRVQWRQALGARWVSGLLQQLVVALWSDPSSGRRLARAADIYARRRQALQTALAAEGIAVTAHSGFNVWIAVANEASVVHSLSDRGWAVAAGERFRLRTGPGIRVTASMLEPFDAGRFAADLGHVLRRSGSTLA